MKLLCELRDEDVGWKSRKVKLKKRIAARAVLLKKNKIALLNVSKHGYHKLPGGGLEWKETIKQALEREILEETGCKIRIISEVGKIVEYKTHEKTLQTSFCFLSKVTVQGEPNFDREEIRDGFRLEWIGMKRAIKMLEKEKPKTYDGKFIIKRDLAFIKTAKNIAM